MNRQCEDCKVRYDDARQVTYCPHAEFLTPGQAARKDAAMKLLGKKVVFWHRPAGVGPAIVDSIDFEGMVSIKGWSGMFHPELFVVEDDTPLVAR
jgi:hypothetical protein